MLGQQLIAWIWNETNTKIFGYYKYHKITIFSTDSHLNHQIFICKQQILEKIIDKAKKTFGIEIKIKDIIFIARSHTSDEEHG